MQHHIISPNTGELFFLSDFKDNNYQSLLSSSALYKILFNTGKSEKIYIDNATYIIKSGEIVFCKPLNTVQVYNTNTKLKVVAFNKEFYKLSSTEEEVSFYWFWYFGIKHPHFVDLTSIEHDFFKMMYDRLEWEFVQSNGCIETVRDILKKIMAVSVTKIETLHNKPALADIQLNVIKKFNTLIEEHFQNKTPFTEIVKSLNGKTSYLKVFFKRYFGMSKFKKVARKSLEKLQRTSEQSEPEIKLQYNSRLKNAQETGQQTSQQI